MNFVSTVTLLAAASAVAALHVPSFGNQMSLFQQDGEFTVQNCINECTFFGLSKKDQTQQVCGTPENADGTWGKPQVYTNACHAWCNGASSDCRGTCPCTKRGDDDAFYEPEENPADECVDKCFADADSKYEDVVFNEEDAFLCAGPADDASITFTFFDQCEVKCYNATTRCKGECPCKQ